jgi:hypothetical protein
MSKVFTVQYCTTTTVAVVADDEDDAWNQFRRGEYVQVEPFPQEHSHEIRRSDRDPEEVQKNIDWAVHGEGA